MRSFLENLQNKPYETRMKILGVTVVLALVVLAIILFWSIKSSVTDVSSSNLDLANEEETNTAKKTQDVAQVEYFERTDKELKLYFTVTNDTNDILNFSDSEHITLTIKDADYHPKSISDRQGNPFVRKVLSHTTNFGVLVFDGITGKEGSLTLDQMGYETADDFFKDEIALDFDQLDSVNKLRE